MGTNDVMGYDVVSTIRQVKEIGKKKHNEFHEMKIFSKSDPFRDSIKKNKLAAFMVSNTKGRSAKSESKDLKIHVKLF